MEDGFDENTVVQGGIRSLDDLVACRRLLAAGKNDEALFTFRLSKDGLQRALAKWDEALQDPALAAQFEKKMQS